MSWPEVKRYNTICGNAKCDEVVDDNQIVISCGCTGPAKTTIVIPDTMSVKIGLVWDSSLGYDTAILIDSDMKELITINDEYITVPTR